MNLIIARHGESNWNVERRLQGQSNASFLTARGKRQAKQGGKLVHSLPIHAIYSSPVRRAFETASLMHTFIDAPLKKEQRLAEIDAGKLGGFNKEDAEREFPGMWDARNHDRLHYKNHGGESYSDAIHRVRSLLSDLSSRHENETILLVSHGGIIKALLSVLILEESNSFLATKIPHDCVHFSLLQKNSLVYLEHTFPSWNQCLPGCYDPDKALL